MLFATAACGEDSPLVILAHTSSVVAQIGAQLTVDVEIRNASGREQVLQVDGCNYIWNWKTDNAGVRVLEHNVACKKNPIELIKLEPGEALTRAVVVGISTAGIESTAGTVTFRVGCQARLGSNLVAEPAAYVWSNPVRVRVH